ncbi:ABC-2 transporter permease [Arthrobacter sp. Sr24]
MTSHTTSLEPIDPERSADSDVNTGADTGAGRNAGSSTEAAAETEATTDASKGPAHARRTNRLEHVPAEAWRKLGLTMLIPFFLVTVMGLAYLGAFHQPEPHNVQVAVVGNTVSMPAFAQALEEKSGDALDVRTVPDEAAARALITKREITAAYAPSATAATLMLSSAASETTANITQKIFMPVAFEQHLPFQVADVVPVGSHDTTGQGLFFMLVALSIGGYASSVPLAGFMGRIRLRTRFVLAALAAAVVATLGVVIAGPIYGVLQSNLGGTWLLSWVYVLAIVMLGLGLHPILRHWTTATLTLLFVALNFTSSGGIFAPEMQPGLFGALHTFWNGAAWYQVAQGLEYFPGLSIAVPILKLVLWLVPGIALMVLTHVWSIRKTQLADENTSIREIEEAVAA